jgi:hypothetical protein
MPHEFLLIEPFWRAGIGAWLTGNGSNPLALTGIWATWGLSRARPEVKYEALPARQDRLP